MVKPEFKARNISPQILTLATTRNYFQSLVVPVPPHPPWPLSEASRVPSTCFGMPLLACIYLCCSSLQRNQSDYVLFNTVHALCCWFFCVKFTEWMSHITDMMLTLFYCGDEFHWVVLIYNKKSIKGKKSTHLLIDLPSVPIVCPAHVCPEGFAWPISSACTAFPQIWVRLPLRSI